MKKKIAGKLSAVLLVGCVCIPLSGCAGKKEETEQTDKSLTLCVDTFINETYQAAFEEFVKTYPDVKLNVEVYDDLILGAQKINTQIMAGEGPDLMILQCYGNADVYKMMRAGAFAPLDDFIKEDSTWNAADYAGAVLDAGVYDGKQMVMPLSYYVPVAVTTKQNLENAGISLDSCNTMLSFLQETSKFYEMDGVKQVLGDAGMMSTFYAYLSESFLDYSEGKLGVEEETLRQACEAYKNFYKEDSSPDSSVKFPEKGYFGIGEQIADGSICMYVSQSTGSFMETALPAAANAQLVLWPFKNSQGAVSVSIMEYAGIRANSENRQNAWNLLRILMGETAQRKVIENGMFCPVLNSVLEEGIDAAKNAALLRGKKITEIAELPADKMQQYQEALMNPDDAVFVTDVGNAKLMEYMRPFYEGESSYEDCFAEFKKFTDVYLTE